MASGSQSVSRRPGNATLALTLALASAGAVALANTDSLVESGFVTALATPNLAGGKQAANVSVPIAGSEDFWLSSAGSPATASREVSLTSWTAPVKLGTSVTLTIAGEPHLLEVVDIADLPAGVTRVDTSSASSRMVVVSLRDAGKPEGAIIRFIVEAGAGTMPQIAVAPPRTL